MNFLVNFSFIFAFLNCFPHVFCGEDSLRLVHVFFRHGSRTPELKTMYPNDPYTIEDFQPMGMGHLTNRGKTMAFQLGKILRKRYSSFLGDFYIPEMVETVSTDYDRTKISALLVLAALFKPSPVQQWHEYLQWLPIPYQYDKDGSDYSLRRPNPYCPTYMRELESVLKSEENLKFLKTHKETLDYIAENTGKPIEKLSDVFDIFQTLTAERYMNFTLPEWTKKVYPEDISNLAGRQCYLENSNAVLKRLNGGRMLSKVIKHMVAKSEDALTPSERKIFLYSGHENNVINILAALNLFRPHVPNYSSAAIIELHYLRDVEEYAVKVLYLRDLYKEPEEQKLENCNVMCPLGKFLKIAAPHVPLNYTAECASIVDLG